MKKGFALVLIFALTMALLTSCQPAAPLPSGSSAGLDESLNYDRMFMKGGVRMCATEDTLYFNFTEEHLIRYVDKVTGIGGPLCGKPECTHDNSDCNAYTYGPVLGLTNYDGRLYWISEGGDDRRYYIYSCAYDGTGRRTVRVLDDEIMGKNIWDPYIQFHQGCLYMGYGSQTVINGQALNVNLVCAFPLDPDQEGYVILEETEISTDVVIQAYKDGVYIVLSRWEQDRADYDLALYRWDIAAKKVEELYRGVVPFSFNEAVWVVEDGIFLYGDLSTVGEDGEKSFYTQNVYKFSFESGMVEWLYQFGPEGVKYNITVTDGLFIGKEITDNNDIPLLIKDLKGQTVLETTLPWPDWLDSSISIGAGYGMDKTYIYFCSASIGGTRYLSVVPLDGSEIKLLWSSDTGS